MDPTPPDPRPPDATSPDDDAPPARFQIDFTGRTLGPYRVERRLAEGGMGGVYLAEDTTLGMRVVVKVPHARFLGEAGFRGRFRREVSELVRLEHPHVVRILARGEDEQVPYFVLQYLGGGSLADRIAERRQRLEDVFVWLRPIAATLDFVHGRGVVHRDVKPGNILFDEVGHVFLSDFGLVKALGPSDDGKRTAEGTTIGSPLYMSPEQAFGKDVSGASDQYGLAATVYEALVGHAPFVRDSLVEALLAKHRDPAPSPREEVPELPVEADAAVRRALDRDPAARFPTCVAFADALAASIERTVAPPAEPPRRRTGVFAVGALAVLLVGAGVATRGFGLLPRASEVNPRVGVGVVEAEGSALVVVAQAGAEPRARRRYGPAEGATDAFVLHSKQTNRMPPPFNAFGMRPKVMREQAVSVRVDRVEPDGSRALAWTLQTPRSVAGEGIAEGQVDLEQRLYDAIGPLTASSIVVPSGETTSMELDVGEDVPRHALPSVAGYEEALRSLEVVLPAAPIGVGAVWDVTRVASTMGIRFQQTTTYELVAIEEDRLRIRFVQRMGAPPQDFEPPGAREGVRVKIVDMTSDGSGSVLLDPQHVLPLEWTSTQSIEMTMEFPSSQPDREPHRFTFTIAAESTIHRDGD